MFCTKFQHLSLRNTQNLIKYRNVCSTFVRRQKDELEQPSIIVEKDNYITLIGINREASRNSIDTATAQKICDALRQFESDDESPVAVLYGVGGSFSAGYDLQEFEQEVESGSFNFLMKHEGGVGPTRRNLSKPVICGINGFCVANGLELALLCDLRVMEDSAVLGFFNRRLGVPISDGGTARLARSIGFSRALDLITTGRRVGVEEALSIGLVNRQVATGTALGQAVHLAFSIAKFPQAALRHDRNSVYANVYGRGSLRQAIQNEVMGISHNVLDEMKVGVNKFINKSVSGDAQVKKNKTDSWSIKEKLIPEWEKVEISHEEAFVKTKKEKQ